jgi:catechol 2,3-dioxygenase-like lactoylglutathione lyase family enzyme
MRQTGRMSPSPIATLRPFSGFSVNDIEAAESFYRDVLGFDVARTPFGVQLGLGDGVEVWVYERPDHTPAAYTMLNLPVDDIDAAVDELVSRGVTFERYAEIPQDEKGIARGIQANMGPDIAWFTDPAGNVLSVLQAP